MERSLNNKMKGPISFHIFFVLLKILTSHFLAKESQHDQIHISHGQTAAGESTKGEFEEEIEKIGKIRKTR
uniref:Uncharacterized protein n=1 Tax=Oryza glumipatula TaxID=40148 RepID=A0A0E0A730_9ORYZ